jgi:putative transposase
LPLELAQRSKGHVGQPVSRPALCQSSSFPNEDARAARLYRAHKKLFFFHSILIFNPQPSFTAMSGDRYFITDQHAPYFITCTVIHWIDLFTRKEYRDIVVDSLNHCVKEKYLSIYGWVIMSNHIHLAVQCYSPGSMSAFLRDFKKFTSKKFIEVIKAIHESRASWLLDKFSFEAKRTGRADNYKIWMDDNHAIYLNGIDAMQKINYIHNNPVRNGIVDYPENYIYSSAIDYAKGKGLVKVEVI